MIASVPRLREEMHAAAEQLVAAAVGGWLGDGRLNNALERFRRADQELQDAKWRLACESYRSVAQWAEDRRYYSDEMWWWLFWRVSALRWAANERRGPLPGFLPSTEIALRPVNLLTHPHDAVR